MRLFCLAALFGNIARMRGEIEQAITLRVLEKFGVAIESELAHRRVLLSTNCLNTAAQLLGYFFNRHPRNKESHDFEFSL